MEHDWRMENRENSRILQWYVTITLASAPLISPIWFLFRWLRVIFKWLSTEIMRFRLLRLETDSKDSRQCFNQWEAKPKPKPIAPCTQENVIFPALWASYRKLLGIVIGSSRCLLLLWLAGVIALVLVFRRSFENHSEKITRGCVE